MEKVEKILWERVFKYVRLLKFVPFLRMVAVCNNLSFGMVNEKSDIDLFIVARKGRLFLVRAFVTFLFSILGVRRHGDKIAGRFCLSFFVDDEFLDLSGIALKNDVYLAFWIKSLVPVLDDGVSKEFFVKNKWIENYLENDFETGDFKEKLRDEFGEITLKFNGFLKRFFEWISDGSLGNFVENRLKNWQLKRAVKKAESISDNSGLLMNEHILKFHNIDRRREYRGLWMKNFGNDKISRKKFSKVLLKK